MVATVGSISIDLSTNSVKFAQGFKGAASTVERESARMSKAVGGIDRAFKSVGTGISAFAAGFAGGIASGAVDLFVRAIGKARDAISEFDDIATKARTTGIGTEMFQALTFAAKQANIEQEQLNSSLEIFAKNTGLAEQETGALFASLQKLNPELLKNIINADNQEERLRLVADALHRTKSAAEEAALSTAVFGKAGVDMGRLLDEGAQSIDKMVENAKRLGIIIPDDLLQRGAELDDMLDTLSTVIGVQFKEALVNLASPLAGAAGGILKFAQDINGLTQAIDAFVKSPGLSTFNDLLGGRLIEGGFAQSLVDAFTGTAGSAEDLQKQLDKVNEEIAETTKGIEELKAAGADLLDIRPATENLKSLQSQARTLRAQLTNIPVTVDTSQATQAAMALASQFRAAENASMSALAAYNRSTLPTVTSHDLSAPTGGAAIGEDGNVTVNTTGPTLHHISVKDFLAGKRAAGGPVKAGGSYPVGERGPEIFTPGTGGYVSPASATSGLLGDAGGALTNVDDQTYDILQEIKRLPPYLETIASDSEAALIVLKSIETAIGDLERSATKYSAVGGTAGGSGGISGYGGGGLSSHTDASQPGYTSDWRRGPDRYGGTGPNLSHVGAFNYTGFASGGAISAGDSQHVEFYKNPNESVEVLRPGQKSRYGGTSIGDIHIHVTGDIGSRQSQLAMRDELHRAVSAAINRP